MYHLTIKTGSKGMGGAHADYIQREGKYSNRSDLIYTESGNMPKWVETPSTFWKAADKYERQNGRAYTEIEFSIPRELTPEERQELAQKYVTNIIGDNHAYTFAIHNKLDQFGQEQPHVHFMFCDRRNDGIERSQEQYFKRANSENPELGGAKKDRLFMHQSFVIAARKEWTATANHYLESKGYGKRIDDRSYEARNIDLESQNVKAIKIFQYNTSTEFKNIQKRNGERIIANPEIAIQVLTSNNSTFSKNDLYSFVFYHTDGENQFKEAYNAVIECPEFKHLAGTEKFTTQELYNIENDIINRVEAANDKPAEKLSTQQEIINHKITESRTFNAEQKQAFDLLTGNNQIASVNGSAGTGKSYVLSAVNENYVEQGYKTHGVALQAITAQSMQNDAGINSSTIASFIYRVENGKLKLDDKSIIVLDEAGMVGSRDMQKLLSITQENNAKIRMVGDSQQLNAVSAGNAYKTVQDKLNPEQQTTLTQIMRQRDETMRSASTDLSKHDVSNAVDKYAQLGKINEFETQDAARMRTAMNWYQSEAESKIMLAYTNKDVTALNNHARDMLRADGKLGQEDFTAEITTKDDKKATLNLAVSDQIIFRQNDKDLGVLNGSKGTIQEISENDGFASMLDVKLSNGTDVKIDLAAYNKINHAYATTIHGSQGLTVDESHILLSNNMTANLAYVGMTRHKDDININYSREEFADLDEVKNQLGKSEQKEFSANMMLDQSFDEVRADYKIEHRETFADRNITAPAPTVQEQPAAAAFDPANPETWNTKTEEQNHMVTGHENFTSQEEPATSQEQPAAVAFDPAKPETWNTAQPQKQPAAEFDPANPETWAANSEQQPSQSKEMDTGGMEQ